MSFRKGLSDMLTSENESKLSSKRVITFIAFLLVAIAFVANLGWGIVMDANVLTGMINVVFAGLGVTVSEHLLKKRGGGENHYGPDSPDDYANDGYNNDGYNPHDRHGGSSPNNNELGDN